VSRSHLVLLEREGTFPFTVHRSRSQSSPRVRTNRQRSAPGTGPVGSGLSPRVPPFSNEAHRGLIYRRSILVSPSRTSRRADRPIGTRRCDRLVQARLTDDEAVPMVARGVRILPSPSDGRPQVALFDVEPHLRDVLRIRARYTGVLVRIRYGATGRAQAIQELVGTRDHCASVSATPSMSQSQPLGS